MYIFMSCMYVCMYVEGKKRFSKYTSYTDKQSYSRPHISTCKHTPYLYLCQARNHVQSVRQAGGNRKRKNIRLDLRVFTNTRKIWPSFSVDGLDCVRAYVLNGIRGTVCLFVCIYVHVHLHVYTYVIVCGPTCSTAFVQLFVCLFVCVLVYMYMYTYMYTLNVIVCLINGFFATVCLFDCLFVRLYVYIHIHIHIDFCVCVCVYIYIYIYIYV
jgi:hypothetical protein